MAEIRLTRKPRSLWPAVLSAAVLVGFVWIVAVIRTGEGTETIPATQLARPIPVPTGAVPTSGTPVFTAPEVAAFLTFTSRDTAPGAAHEYAAAGIGRLSGALGAIVEREKLAGGDVRKRLNSFQEAAQDVEARAAAGVHAERVRDAFMNAAGLLSTVQRDRWPDADRIRSDVERVRASAAAIDSDRPLVDQTATVREFFDAAADVVRAMTHRT